MVEADVATAVGSGMVVEEGPGNGHGSDAREVDVDLVVVADGARTEPGHDAGRPVPHVARRLVGRMEPPVASAGDHGVADGECPAAAGLHDVRSDLAGELEEPASEAVELPS